MSVPFDSIRIKNRIREGLEKAYTEVDPILLSRYRDLFKKEVSLFRRSYAAAYFLMELDQGASRHAPERSRTGSSSRGGRGSFRHEGKSGEGIYPGAAPIPEEESTRLFFGAGRSRRVFPRELLGIILSRTTAGRDDVGIIRILDNYSFVQVRASVADGIIGALNGKPFRGRPLTVNYARERKTPENGAETGGAFASADDDDHGDTGYGNSRYNDADSGNGNAGYGDADHGDDGNGDDGGFLAAESAENEDGA